MHFQTWEDKAGNAPTLTDPTDPSLVFPNLNAAPFGGEDFQTNLIMPEPPYSSAGASRHAQSFAQRNPRELPWELSREFFAFLTDLAEDADDARRECEREDK
jgi:hypothetical protein